jgi:hypothetical protein
MMGLLVLVLLAAACSGTVAPAELAEEACAEMQDALDAGGPFFLGEGHPVGERRPVLQREADELDREVIIRCGETRRAYAAAGGETAGGRTSVPERAEPDEESQDANPVEGSELDRLHSQCAEGDMAACDDLYMQAPWNSDLEAFGASCGDRREDRSDGVWCEDEVPSDMSPEEESFFAMAAAFDRLSAEQQLVLCTEADRGMSEAVAAGGQMAEASNGTVTANEAAAFLRTVC